jgi:hypothetical protein
MAGRSSGRFWPYGGRALRPRVYPASAGTWRAAGGQFSKLRSPARVPIQSFSQRITVPIGIDGQVSALVGAAGSVTLFVGPQGVGASWALDQAGFGTSVGAADTATAAVYVGPQATQPYFVAQSYAGGGDAAGLAGIVLQPGEFVWVVWSGGTSGSTAQLKVSGLKSALAAG